MSRRGAAAGVLADPARARIGSGPAAERAERAERADTDPVARAAIDVAVLLSLRCGLRRVVEVATAALVESQPGGRGNSAPAPSGTCRVHEHRETAGRGCPPGASPRHPPIALPLASPGQREGPGV